MPPKVGAVRQGLVIHLEHDVVDLVCRFQIRAVGKIVGDVHNAGVVVADAQLLFRAAHAVGGVPRELARCNGNIADLRAHLGKRGLHPDTHVRRAADHVGQSAVARIHL